MKKKQAYEDQMNKKQKQQKQNCRDPDIGILGGKPENDCN